MFDIATLKPLDEARVQLKHPVTNEPLDGVFFTICGQDSKEYRQSYHAYTSTLLSDTNKDITDEEKEAKIEKATLDIVVACTKNVEGMALQDKPIEYSPENVKWLYENYEWIRKQIDVAIHDKSLFFSMKQEGN